MPIRTALTLVTIFAGSFSIAQEINIPPTLDGAEVALSESTRHQEYVRLPLPDGGEVNTFVVYPERPDKAPLVIVIHEIFGMSDWSNSVADNFAKHGFIALAPDMVTGMEGNPMGTVRALTREQIVARLDAVREYARTIPAGNGRVGVIGFCWGGSASWIYATAQPKLDAAVVCYGSAPDETYLENVEAPVLGLYGENDARVNVTIEPAKEVMDRLGKSFAYEIYDGAGHGFIRATDASEANLEAAKQAWPRAIAFLREHTETTAE